MTLKTAGYALLVGMLGMLLMQGARHVYYDHVNLHAIAKAIVTAQQKAAKP